MRYVSEANSRVTIRCEAGRRGKSLAGDDTGDPIEDDCCYNVSYKDGALKCGSATIMQW